MWIDTQASSESGFPVTSWRLKSLTRAFLLQVSFGQSFRLPGSRSIFGVSQDPPCAHTCHSQEGLYHKNLCVAWTN